MTQKKTLSTQIILVALVLTALGGCLEQPELDSESHNTHSNSDNQDSTSEANSSPEPEPAPEPKPSKETGSVTGEVVDNDYNALERASVKLFNHTEVLANTTTDKDGIYTINDIPPGRFSLEFNADCCRETVEVIDVEADETMTVNVVLEIWDTSRDAYVLDDGEWTGYISCAIGSAHVCAYNPESKNQHDFEVNVGIRSLIVGLHWGEDGFNHRDCYNLWLSQGVSERSQDCQSKPLEMRLDAGSMNEDEDFDNLTEPTSIRATVRASGEIGLISPDSNIIVQQKFTLYWHQYYWEHAPEGASALPDQ